MPDVATTFTARADHLEAAVARANAQILGFKEKLGQVRAESQKGTDSMTAWGRVQVLTLRDMASGYVTVGAAIAGVTRAYGEWGTIMDDIARKSKEHRLSLMGEAARAGELPALGQAEDRISAGVRAGLGTREQLTASYMGAAAGAPTASINQKWALAAQGAKLGRAFGTEGEGLSALQQNSEMIGRVSDLLGKSPREASNLVEHLKATVGPKDAGAILERPLLGAIRALVKSGATDAEGAIGLAESAIHEKLSPRILESLAQKITSPGKAPAIAAGHIPTAEQRAQMEWVGKTDAQRYEAFMKDPDRFAADGITGLDKIARLSPAYANARRAEMLAARGRDLAAEAAGSLTGSAMGVSSLEAQGLATLRSGAEMEMGPAATERERDVQRVETILSREHASWLRRSRVWASYYAGRTWHDINAAIPGGQSPFPDQENEGGFMYPSNRVNTSTEIRDEIRAQRRELQTQSATNAAQAARVNGRE